MKEIVKVLDVKVSGGNFHDTKKRVVSFAKQDSEGERNRKI